ncbi:MAG TPA: alginate export family protein [Azospirillum sp.]|nr:alginate export family protein [Azospirillum sp.]
MENIQRRKARIHSLCFSLNLHSTLRLPLRAILLLCVCWPITAGIAAAQSAAPAQTEKSDNAPSASQNNQRPRYYKGKSLGQNNSHIIRHDEDYSYLRTPAKAASVIDRLKYIPLNESGDAYLSLNGEVRYRFDYTENKNFRIAPSATVPTTPGAPLRLASPRPPFDSALHKRRYALGADLHLGEHVRLYADLWHAQQTGHGAGPVIPASQRNNLEIINGFAEFMQTVGDARTGIRVGRQALFFGNSHNVAANIATSLPDPVFNGVRTYADWGSARVDAFAYNAYRYEKGYFAGSNNPDRNLWGVYSSIDLPAYSMLGEQVVSSLDAFYYGFRAVPGNNGPGTGLYNVEALRVSPTVSATQGFLASLDRRHTFGLRYYGGIGPVTYDWDAAIQRGSYGSFEVDAWAFNTDTAYTFTDLPWRPRIGTHIDGASGGASRADRTLRTYQPLFPDTLYYLPNSFFSPTNFYDIAPRIRVTPAPGLSVDFYYAFLWRYTTGDAVYNGNWKGANGTNAYAVTALTPGHVIGRMPNLTITWTPLRNIIMRTTVARFLPGNALKAALARDTTYVNAQMTLKF